MTWTSLHVRHETRYAYNQEVLEAKHLAFLRPRERAYQKVLSYALEIEPEPTMCVSSEDAFGNTRTFIAIEEPHLSLLVAAESEVRTRMRDLPEDFDKTTPWEDIARLHAYTPGDTHHPAVEFVFPSPLVPLSDELTAYARDMFVPGMGILKGASDLCARINTEFDYVPASTTVETHVSEAFSTKRGVCQDFAHIMIAGLRGLGLPAAYVSGYLLTEPPPGQPKLVGADASHAWVSVWCPEAGWVDFDPTNNVLAGPTHIELALGRDFSDVSPLKGVITGGGAHVPQVGVTVTPLD